MSVPTTQSETIRRLKKFVLSVSGSHKFAIKNVSQRQSNFKGHLKDALFVDGTEIPEGTRYVVFGLPGKVKSGAAICTFFLRDCQLTVRDSSLDWIDYNRPIRQPSAVLF